MQESNPYLYGECLRERHMLFSFLPLFIMQSCRCSIQFANLYCGNPHIWILDILSSEPDDPEHFQCEFKCFQSNRLSQTIRKLVSQTPIFTWNLREVQSLLLWLFTMILFPLLAPTLKSYSTTRFITVNLNPLGGSSLLLAVSRSCLLIFTYSLHSFDPFPFLSLSQHNIQATYINNFIFYYFPFLEYLFKK